ncbi:50S ribosomal protein L11 methyltransferase [Candidatus Poribacteria bacterium]|nr:MAG: 50S ribosomal protein L11 methyltransferase [Candidatus Poribacteria bacterium]
MKWAQVTITTSQEASDAVANYLFESDATGVEIRDNPASNSPSVTLISYFPTDDLIGERVHDLRKFLASLIQVGIDTQPAKVTLESIEEDNWSDQWRSAFPPQKLGKRLVIAPTWDDIVPEPSEVLIRLDPGMAFGTGQHPTTQLALELLEISIKGADAVADIGTGSGILAIAAAKLGAKRVDAVDLDATTIPIAQSNIQINKAESIIRLHQGDGLNALERQKYPLIIANILTKVLLPMIPICPTFLEPAGRLILSGILVQEASQIEAQLEANGFRVLEVRQLKESHELAQTGENWIGILAQMKK